MFQIRSVYAVPFTSTCCSFSGSRPAGLYHSALPSCVVAVTAPPVKVASDPTSTSSSLPAWAVRAQATVLHPTAVPSRAARLTLTQNAPNGRPFSMRGLYLPGFERLPQLSVAMQLGATFVAPSGRGTGQLLRASPTSLIVPRPGPGS